MEQLIPNSDAVRLVAAVPLKPTERDALLIDMHTRLTRIEAHTEALPDHESRIRKLEKLQWGLPGTLIVALLAALGIHL